MSNTKTDSVIAPNIFLKIAIVKVADDYKADSAEFVNFGRFATEVCVSKNIKLRLRDKPTNLPLLILSVAFDF